MALHCSKVNLYHTYENNPVKLFTDNTTLNNVEQREPFCVNPFFTATIKLKNIFIEHPVSCVIAFLNVCQHRLSP